MLTGTVSAAAELMGRSQPAVSRALRRLGEKRLAQRQQHDMLEHVGMVAGMEGVAVVHRVILASVVVIPAKAGIQLLASL